MADIELWMERIVSDDDSTIGTLLMDGAFAGFTCEDEFRLVKVPKETRIPAGRYEIKLRKHSDMLERYEAKFGPWHTGMLWLQDVPNFEWIYIHIGNTERHTAGCILVGDGAMTGSEMRIIQSTECYRRLALRMIPHIDHGDRAFITIVDKD